MTRREPITPAARPSRVRLAALAALLLLLTGCQDGGDAGPSTDVGATGGLGWEQLPRAPLEGRTSASVVAIDDRLFVFGGWAFLCPPNADCGGPSDPPFTDGAVLDLGSREWSPIADAPFPLYGASTGVVDGDIYVLHRRRLLSYAPGEDAWTEHARLPKRSGTVLVASDHGLLAVAGTEESGDADDAVYDPAADAWTFLPEDPLGETYDRFAVPDGDRLLLFASQIGEPDEQVRDKAVAAFDWVTRTWSVVSSAPAGGYQAWRIGDRVFLNPHFSRTGGGILDLASDTWSTIPIKGSGFEGDAAGVISAEGATYEYAAGSVFDARSDVWLEVPQRDEGSYDMSVAALGQRLVTFGGQRWVDGGDGMDGELLSELWIWTPPA